MTLLNLTGEFTPESERGPDDVASLVDQINDQFINYWSGCESLQLEVAGEERPNKWACTSCHWKGPVAQLEGDFRMCPRCNDDVVSLTETNSPTSLWVICKNDFPFEVAPEERARERLAELLNLSQSEGKTVHYHIHGCPVV